MRQLRHRSARALRLVEVPHAEVEGRQKQAAGAQALAQMFLRELSELKLEFLG